MDYDATIVMPLRRQVDEWLEELVRSALLQSVPTEVIVVRSETTPASNLRILDGLQRHFANLAVIGRDKPESYPGAINKGIRHARSERVGIIAIRRLAGRASGRRVLAEQRGYRLHRKCRLFS